MCCMAVKCHQCMVELQSPTCAFEPLLLGPIFSFGILCFASIFLRLGQVSKPFMRQEIAINCLVTYARLRGRLPWSTCPWRSFSSRLDTRRVAMGSMGRACRWGLQGHWLLLTRGRPKNSLCIHICRRERVGRLGRTLAISMCALGGIVLVVAFIIMLEPGVEQQSFSMGWFLAR